MVSFPSVHDGGGVKVVVNAGVENMKVGCITDVVVVVEFAVDVFCVDDGVAAVAAGVAEIDIVMLTCRVFSGA